LEFQQQAKNYYQKIDGFSFNSEELDTTNHPKTIVLVLGETARSDHFSLNGYSRNTNPKLSAISNLISFSRAYSPSNLTQPSMAMLFSRATPQTFQRVYQEPSFITAFKENDYKVYWFSNHDYSPSSPIGFYSEEADTLIQNNISLSAPKGTDSSLVELFKNSFKTTSSIKKRLFIIHTLGSHFRYSSRYPDSFEQFTPVLPQNLPITSINQTFKQELINSYDNSILYTDYVLAQLIRTLEKEQGISLLTYVSDHGENLLEAPNHLILHGNPNPTEKEIHVPMLTWFSKEYQYAFPKKILALRQNKDLFFSTSLFPFYLWGLANIHIPEAILHLGDTQYQEPDTLFVLSDEYRGGILQKTPINQYQMEPHY
jgi:glucan phosphoethanolaminetransferase (alkaline phosphatase superfamily)